MQGVQLDPSLLTHLLSACLEAGAWDPALQLCSAALVGQGPAVAPLYNHVLQQAAAAGQFRVVVEVLTAMRAAGLEVDPEAAAMVSVCACSAVPGFTRRVPPALPAPAAWRPPVCQPVCVCVCAATLPVGSVVHPAEPAH